jgi:hypothetical protein
VAKDIAHASTLSEKHQKVLKSKEKDIASKTLKNR